MQPQPRNGVLISSLVIGVAACLSKTATTKQTPPWGDRPECPSDSAVGWVTYASQEKKTGSVTWQALDEIPLSGPISKIPEFHDCQRFILQGDTYGPLYAIYASFRLGALAQRAESLIDTTVSHGRTGVPAATIFSYGGTYPDLGIEPGFNCLYLSNPPKWRARMVPKGYAEPDCLDPVDPSLTPGTELDVRPTVVGSFADEQYPPVARWDWDTTNGGRQAIGIKCGAAWCEIGSHGFVLTPVLASPPQLAFDGVASTDVVVRVVSQIKGWNDAQRLDSMVAGKQVPTSIWGTIVPHPMVDMVDDVLRFKNKWLHVADAVLEGGAYPKRNFTEGINKVSFCHGVAVPSSAVSTSATPLGCHNVPGSVTCAVDPTDGIPWYAMIVSAASDTVYKCVQRRVHSGTNIPKIPGAARWRWVVNDATNWIKCPSGCCEIH